MGVRGRIGRASARRDLQFLCHSTQYRLVYCQRRVLRAAYVGNVLPTAAKSRLSTEMVVGLQRAHLRQHVVVFRFD